MRERLPYKLPRSKSVCLKRRSLSPCKENLLAVEITSGMSFFVVVGVLWQQHCIGRPSRLKRSSVIVKSTSRGLQNTVVEFVHAEHIL